MKQPIYLDFASATPMDNRVIKAMKPYFKDKFYNPSANSLQSKTVKQDLEAARNKVAKILGSRPTEIIFTAGGTEANNLALFGVCGAQTVLDLRKIPATPDNPEQLNSSFSAVNIPMGSFPSEKRTISSALDLPGADEVLRKSSIGHIVTTALEHESVLAPAHQLVKRGWKLSEIKPDNDGLIDVNKITKAITDKTILVSVMYANNEVGTIQPIKQIGKGLKIIREQRKKNGNHTPIYLHTDAAQAVNYLDIHVNNLGVDLMTINGGKIYGPKQSGVLYVKSGTRLAPLIFGGGQEWSLRSGTENVAGCIGFAEALSVTDAMRSGEVKRLKQLQSYCFKNLKLQLPQVIINGSTRHRLPNNVHLSVPGSDNEWLTYSLEEKGIICAVGSACSASKDESSHVLLAMGMTEADVRASLRLSFGRSTTKKDVDKFIASLKTLLLG